MLSGVGDERIHRRHCFYMAGRREWRNSAAGRVCGRLGAGGLRLIPMWVCAPYPGKPYFTVEGRKPFARERRRRLWGFAPHTRESLILPLRGANFLPGKGAGGRGVCAPHPGKPYSSVEGRKPFARERRRRPREFAPHTSESLILPLRGANLLPGKGAGGCGSLRPTPRKALFFR